MDWKSEREFIWQLLLICKEICIVAIALESLPPASQSRHHNCYYRIKWQLSLIPFFRSFAFTWLLFNCFNSIFHFDYMLALCDSATLHSVLLRSFFFFLQFIWLSAHSVLAILDNCQRKQLKKAKANHWLMGKQIVSIHVCVRAWVCFSVPLIIFVLKKTVGIWICYFSLELFPMWAKQVETTTTTKFGVGNCFSVGLELSLFSSGQILHLD